MADQAMDALAQLEDVMLTKMWESARASEWGDDGCAFGLRFFRPIPTEVARGVLRNMRNEGKVVFWRGLWSEDGEPMGAGYALSRETCLAFRKAEAEAAANNRRERWDWLAEGVE